MLHLGLGKMGSDKQCTCRRHAGTLSVAQGPLNTGWCALLVTLPSCSALSRWQVVVDIKFYLLFLMLMMWGFAVSRLLQQLA